MPAYSFRARFAEPILAGTKGGTIRAPRKPANRGIHTVARQAKTGGHAYPGEELSLYTGMRTKHCQLIARKACIAVERIRLDFGHDRLILNGVLQSCSITSLQAFGIFDGFTGWDDMREFWQEIQHTDYLGILDLPYPRAAV